MIIIKDEEGKINEKLTDEVVDTLDTALHRKRLVSFGFVFKEVHKKLNLDDTEDGDLKNTDNDDEIRSDLFSVILRYQWNIGIKNYKLIEIVEDDLEEKRKLIAKHKNFKQIKVFYKLYFTYYI